MVNRRRRALSRRRNFIGDHYKRFRRQRGEVLSRYDFAYAGRVTVNHAMKGLDTLAPKLIKQTSGEGDRLVKNRISQIINEGGGQIEKIAPRIIRGAIEDVYKTPFRLLGNFGKQKLTQVKRKFKSTLKRFK